MSDKKYSILTYIIGDYEFPREIIEKDPDAEYILVTDNPKIKSDTWTVVQLDEQYKNLSTFDKCYEIRFNPFKYVTTDLVIRMDGNIQIKKPLRPIINAFIKGHYDLALMPHPLNSTFTEEYNLWINARNYPTEQRDKFFKLLADSNYDLSYKSLIQMTFSIHKNDKLNKDLLQMTYMFLKYLGTENEIYRLDQTVFSYVLNYYFKHAKILPLSEQILHDNSLMQWYWHNSNNPNNNCFYDTTLKTPDIKYLFNKPVTCAYVK